MATVPEAIFEEFGANAEFVADLYLQWRYSPVTVSEEWRQYFESLVGPPVPAVVTPAARDNGSRRPPAAAPVAPAPPEAVERAALTAAALIDPDLAPYERAERLKGVATMIVDNMEESLGLPVATSQRMIPVKVLEENRRTINQYLAKQGRKVSFTHVIAWAIIEALGSFPQMNTAFALVDGRPHRIVRDDVNLGVAIDVERRDGSRSLIVPNIKAANSHDFNTFLTAYNDVVDRARGGKLTTADFQGTTLTLTNPGTIGTVSSVPRLMAGQGTIVATGTIAYPPEYSGSAPEVLADLGISKVMTITSTYDHRIIQGAESGMFLARIHQLLIGEDEFYDRIFRALLIPYPPVRWAQDNRIGPAWGGDVGLSRQAKEASVLTLIRATRVRGHLLAHLNPLEFEPKQYHPDLDPATYGLTLWDLDRKFVTDLAGMGLATLRKILDVLRRTYSGHVGVEFMNIQEPEERAWLQNRLEHADPLPPLPSQTKLQILAWMSQAEAFEQFLHRRYVGHKRFSLEGAETVVPLLDTIFDRAAEQGIEEAVMGMAHRGRLNVLKNILNKSARAIFSEFEGSIDPETTQGTGDVKYHLGTEGTRHAPGGEAIRVTLASNPSHLEAVNPVVEGMTHAKQRHYIGRPSGLAIDRVLAVLVHGDAAFAGQGIVAETLNLAQLRGYRTGGTIHIVINNQIGFTTTPQDARSTPFATDIAKLSQIPIFHVNGDDPEAAVRVAELAFEYRQRFEKDVVIDLVCYRRWGHNEGDDPSYTQPQMYKVIDQRNSPREVYAQQLLREGVIQPEDAQQQYDAAIRQLEEQTQGLAALPTPEIRTIDTPLGDLADEVVPATAVPIDRLLHISRRLAIPPEAFNGHPKLLKQLQRRELTGDGSDRVDWATAEALAFGSLLMEGRSVRLSGQDSGRGTFSQRHAVLHNFETSEVYVPLNNLADDQGVFKVYDSLLSEAAVLGFEFGYSLAAPDALVLWEAQFGDFANGAQVIIDQFISSSAVKWSRYSDLVMLLPHGFEGQGPEHSSARLERYLQLCAQGNMNVAYPTTPASYFHLLRRQKHDDIQRPLIVMTPKSLLRLPAALSPLEALTSGDFRYILDDPEIDDPTSVQRVVMLSGKLYYDAAARRNGQPVALVRLEQLYPYPRHDIREILARYPNARSFVWAQEEPENQGAWSYIRPWLEEDLPDGARLIYVGRPRSASPATGSFKVHTQEQNRIIDQLLTL